MRMQDIDNTLHGSLVVAVKRLNALDAINNTLEVIIDDNYVAGFNAMKRRLYIAKNGATKYSPESCVRQYLSVRDVSKKLFGWWYAK